MRTLPRVVSTAEVGRGWLRLEIVSPSDHAVEESESASYLPK